MAKSKAQSNKEQMQRIVAGGGKKFQILLTGEDVKRIEEFKTRHGLSTNKQMLNFILDYKSASFNDVVAVPAGEMPAGDCFIYKGKKYQILETPVYGSMCREVETGFVFPTP
jgi:hypothetical protein